MQQFIDILPQPPQLRRRGDAAGQFPLPVNPQGQIAGFRQRVVLHSPQHIRLRQQQTGALQFLLPHGRQRIRQNVPLRCQNVVAGRQIQHTCRFDFFSEILLARFLQREQVQQHLNIQSHPHRRQIKGLAAGLIVHHPQIQLIILDPAVHTVHLAAHSKFRVRLPDHH